jgi:hypothetical protein
VTVRAKRFTQAPPDVAPAGESTTGAEVVKLPVLAALVFVVTVAAADARPVAETVALAERLAALPGGPPRPVLEAALAAYDEAARQGALARRDLLTVIDYTRPSTERRLWVLDLARGRVLFHELVAHGKNSGDNITRFFSNAHGSLMTSLGLFVTGTPYVGQNGYSLRLRGLDPGVNDNAFDRAIVMHGASYVSAAIAARLGRLGRSWGCPAVPARVARDIIDTIKDGSAIFAYGPARPAALTTN